MKRYLVTGGLGFLGTGLVKALVREGHRVRVLDNESRGRRERLGDCEADVELVGGDIRDADTVRDALRGMESVCHLAFVNGTRHFYERPADVLEIGVKGIVNVLDGCLAAGVPELILASSSEVYQTPPRIPTDETVPLSIPDPHNPRYSYGGGKIISELMALNYGRDRLARVVVFRPHNVYGPDMGDEHVIPQLTQRLVHAAAGAAPGSVVDLALQGDGSQSRAFIYVDDFVAGAMAVIGQGRHREIYNIGTMDETPIRALAEGVGRCLGWRVRVIAGAAAAGGTERRCPDTRKLQALGFAPRVSLREGLERTVPWYAEHAAAVTETPRG